MLKKKSLAFVIVLISLSLLTVSVFAVSNVTIYDYYTDTVILQSGHGGRNVHIDVYNNSDGFVNDVRMLGWSGNTVWEEFGAIGASGSRTFWCGSDVAKIQIKVRKVSPYAYPISTCTCNVSFP